ncbi:MAG: ABC transporter ATP-binding protein [Anaerovoracaceae bacterium]
MKIEVNNLSFSYGKKPVLENLSFSVEEETLLCLLGGNGVGKSTLFRCILGLQRHYEGSILIEGKEVSKLSPKALAKKIAYVPQHISNSFSYNVFHTVLMGTTPFLTTLSSPKKSEEDLAYEALKELGILHLANRNCMELSGGERQLVLLARALAQKAKILILDEPTANLDYGNQIMVLEQTKKLTSKGYTVLLCTHNPEHAFLYGTKALVLQNGREATYGLPKEILTEKLLNSVYHTNIKLETLRHDGGEMTVCIPLPRKETSNVYLD